ncbi:hypothetical protein [Streptomyces sp. NPDC058457]|uniref:hypothetical protein n=1 Tax=Streptomyces sp. NPDC058457 TaxID=3346507 RepID=UPI0036544F4B
MEICPEPAEVGDFQETRLRRLAEIRSDCQLRGVGNSLWPANLDYTVFDEATGAPTPRPPAKCMPGTPSSKAPPAAPPTLSPSGGPSTTRTAPAW